jgi:LPS export ABC transporter permease LptG
VVRYDVAMRERSTVELIDIARSGEVAGDAGKSAERRTHDLRTAQVELHRRFAVPAASIVFALLALPLGIGSRSGGRGRGFVISVAVVLVYYVLGNNGEVLAMEGTLPVWLGMWLPNITLTVLALVLMSRMGRWLGERQSREGPIHRITRRWQEWRLARQARHAAPGHARPTHSTTIGVSPEVRRQRRSTRFPALLDRYVVARLLAPLLLVLASTASLYIVIDLTEHVSAMADHEAPLTVILAYYWNLMPQVLVDVIPFGMLIAVLIVLTTLERQHELTALKGGGVSLFRLLVPVLLVASVGGIAMWLLAENAVPQANREKDRLLDIIEGKEAARSYRITDRQWLLSQDGETFYNFLRYDAGTKTLLRLTIYRIDEHMRLTFHQFAHRARWEDGSWVADGGWFRQFFPDGTDEFRRITKPLKLQVPEGPEYFGQEYSSPSEMSFGELEQYIHELEESGYKPSELMVRLQQKLSYPLSAVIMVWLAVPFALNRGGRRVTTMQGVALALGLGIGYSILVTVFGKLGEAELLPPVAGAWAPVLLGMLFAMNRMTTLRT